MTNIPLEKYQSNSGDPTQPRWDADKSILAQTANRPMTGLLPTNDSVNHPSHYCKGPIECFEAMKSAFTREEMIAYCRIAAFKYIWRAGDKGPMNQDFKKAIWYLNKAAEMTETPVV